MDALQIAAKILIGAGHFLFGIQNQARIAQDFLQIGIVHARQHLPQTGLFLDRHQMDRRSARRAFFGGGIGFRILFRF